MVGGGGGGCSVKQNAQERGGSAGCSVFTSWLVGAFDFTSTTFLLRLMEHGIQMSSYIPLYRGIEYNG